MKSRGFTFIELIIILTIIGVLAVAVNVRSPGQELRLTAQKERVVQDIRYTQSLAMSRGQRSRMVFGSNTYQIEWRNPANNWVSINNPTSGSNSQSLEQPFAFSGTTLRDRTLVFDSIGKPLQGASMMDFSTNETVTISGGSGGGGGCSRNRGAHSGLGVITINENTGYVW
ncbi:MAG: GspH/FimT family pseudopilin [Thermodesulfobacteriota bacterium]